LQLELHQLERRYAGLRIAEPGRRARLEASLAREGQQSPVLVVADGEQYVLVDGYLRVAALQRLGRDIVEAVVLPMEEAAALVEVWKLETTRRRSALEDGWLLAELVERHGHSQVELAVLLRRSKSWVSERLGLVRALPEPVQQAVRQGIVPPQGAMKFLVPWARAHAAHCERLVAALGSTAISVRELQRLYMAWRSGDDALRERLVAHPRLFLKAEDAVAQEVEEDEGLGLVRQLEALAGMVGRIRRRLREGVFTRVNTASRQNIARSWDEAHLVFQSLAQLMHKEVQRAGSGDSDRDPAPSS